MPFNSTDFTKAPWADGIMTLTHEEVLEVKEACQTIIDDHPVESVADFYVYAQYNMIDWTRGINGHTYAVLKMYDPEVHTQGIDEQGIILSEEPVEELPEPELPVEEEPPTTEITPAE